MRIRITFAKTEAMRFTSHLDLHRTWERTLRRAGLPLAYSQGYNPHPKINLASALPLGFTGGGEVVDVGLEHDLSLSEIEAALKRAAPPGIQIGKVERVDEHSPTLQTMLEASEYVITLGAPLPDLDQRLDRLLAEEHLPRQRRGKDYDLRPLIFAVDRLPEIEPNQPRLLARLNADQAATGRPEELLDALGADPAAARIHRTRLIFHPS